jgi:hypothetical protein
VRAELPHTALTSGHGGGTALEVLEEGSVDTEIFRQSNISRSIHTTFSLKVRVLDGEHAGETVL